MTILKNYLFCVTIIYRAHKEMPSYNNNDGGGLGCHRLEGGVRGGGQWFQHCNIYFQNKGSNVCVQSIYFYLDVAPDFHVLWSEKVMLAAG